MAINKNWYKKAQKLPTMKNIIWAIDKIISENYEFSVEELQQASQGISSLQKYIPKAAQTIDRIDPKHYEILDLFDRGKTTRSIGQEVGMSSPEVAAILKKYFPSKQHQQEYLRKKHEKNILNVTDDLTQKMKNDFSIYDVTIEEISSILNIDPPYVRQTLAQNNVSLLHLKKERRDIIAINIAEIAKKLPKDFKQQDIIKEFEKKYGFKLTDRAVFSAMKLNNLGEKNQNNPAAILQAFTTFINDNITGGVKYFLIHPEKISIYVDKFFKKYGKDHGFAPPIKQEKLKDMFMTGIQLAEKTKERSMLEQYPSKYVDNESKRNKIIKMLNNGVSANAVAKQMGETVENVKNLYRLYQARHTPIITDDTHPSYFLNNPEANNELV